jgi:hypothetical protein
MCRRWCRHSPTPAETINRSDALNATGSIASLLFEMRERRLHLRSSDQTLAAAAVHGHTDPELALELGISLAAVKKRWLALYDRMGRLEPGLLADATADADKATRGPQKRHRVLAHLRQHPEELKPW